MLDQSDIAHYLLSLGLVKPRDVIDEELAIADTSGRNRVYVATTRSGPTYVIKQAGPRSAATLAHEAAVLRALAAVPALAGQVPGVVREDPEGARLVLRTPAGARDWSDHHGSGRFPRLPPRDLGRVLAALHRVAGDAVETLPAGHDRMWGLSLPEPSHELLLDLSAGAQDVVARVQASETVCARLQELRDGCPDDAIVHGDLRWENCLAVTAPRSVRRTRVLLIDWELAGRGTAAFDVGTVIAEYLRAWVGSVPIVDVTDPGRLVARAGHPLRAMRPALQAFTASYWAASAQRPPLRRVVELAAVRILQIAVERAQGLARATAHVVTLLQLADNMLRDPDAAAAGLLGLRA